MNGPFVTPDFEEAFLGSARAFLSEALTPELRAEGRAKTGVH